MDTHGIGAALWMALRLLDMAGRRSGKTTRMVEAAKDGDLLVFVNRAEADRVDYLLAKMGKSKVNTVVARDMRDFFERAAGIRLKGRLTFDHAFVRDHYQRAIDRAAAEYAEAEMRLGVEHSGRAENAMNQQAAAFGMRVLDE